MTFLLKLLYYYGNDWEKHIHIYFLNPVIDFINGYMLIIEVKLARKIELIYFKLISIGFIYLFFLLIIYPNYFLVLIIMGIFGA